MRRQVLTLLAALLLGAALFLGIAHLFSLRFERGDVYPPYSTLRTDPLGAKAFFEALDSLPQVEAQRNYRPLPRLRTHGPVTFFYAGVPHRAAWGAEELRVFEALISSGSRAVFAFAPAAPDRSERQKKSDAKNEVKEPAATPAPEGKADGAKKKKSDREADDEEAEIKRIAFAEVAKRWGFQFEIARDSQKNKTYERRALRQSESGLEPELSWHSALHFSGLQPAWKILYACDGKPVLIERAWGAGSIVLAADSFFLSNEALRRERHPRLLAWLGGSPHTMVFDEEHHGVAEQSDLFTLIHKYRLQGAVAALLLVVALFVWKSCARFIPPQESKPGDGGEVVAGRDSSEGFAALLRRSIPPSQIVKTCVEEWRKSFAHQPRELAKVEAALAENAQETRDAVSAYRRIAAALAKPQGS